MKLKIYLSAALCLTVMLTAALLTSCKGKDNPSLINTSANTTTVAPPPETSPDIGPDSSVETTDDTSTATEPDTTTSITPPLKQHPNQQQLQRYRQPKRLLIHHQPKTAGRIFINMGTKSRRMAAFFVVLQKSSGFCALRGAPRAARPRPRALSPKAPQKPFNKRIFNTYL